MSSMCEACVYWCQTLRAQSGLPVEEMRGSERYQGGLSAAYRGWAMLWAEAAPYPRPAEESHSLTEPHKWQLAFCPLLSASPGEPSWPHVHLVSVPCSSWVPLISLPYLPRGTEAWGWGGGWPRTQEVPCGGLWARPELAATPGGKDIPRLAEKSPLPPPATTPPCPQLQRRRVLGAVAD